jgi:hypothetical protein
MNELVAEQVHILRAHRRHLLSLFFLSIGASGVLTLCLLSLALLRCDIPFSSSRRMTEALT